MVLQEDPEHINALTNRGILYILSDQYEKALKDIKKYTKLEPENTDYWVDLGDAYRELDDTSKAVESYKKAIALDPKNSDAFMSLGDFYSMNDEYEKAQFYVNKGFLITKEDALLYAVQGDIFYFKDNFHYKEALKAYLKSFKLKEDADVAYDIGLCYEELGDDKKTLIYYQKGIDLGSDDPDCYSDLAYLIYEEVPFEAIILIDKALVLDPENIYAHEIRGDALSSVGLYEEAIKSYTNSINIDSTSKWSYYDRAYAYEMLEEFDAAIADYTGQPGLNIHNFSSKLIIKSSLNPHSFDTHSFCFSFINNV